MTAPSLPAGPPREPLKHFVSTAPFDPYSVERMTAEQERYYLASQWRMMWWKLKRHRLAVIAGVILMVMYTSILFSEIIAPYNLHSRFVDYIYAPPQRVHVIHDGQFVGPFVYGFHYSLNLDNLQRIYTPLDGKTVPLGLTAAPPARIQKLRFLCFGDSYEYLGVIPGSFHLVCPAQDGTMFLMGTDRLGRDMLSRIVNGTRISLTVGLIGVTISFLLGIIIGGFAGYYGGWIDIIVQRVIEVLRSLPELPLWLALSAALPVHWSPLLIYFGITIILGLLDWTGLARAVRSKLLSLREEDFCTAAQLMGASPSRIIGRHLLPSFMSHLIASATLRVPAMILGETALSFLGLGLRPPITSWGVLLNEAQNINVVVLYPWLMLPVLPVVIMVLSFNFFGDGLRDAADPYK